MGCVTAAAAAAAAATAAAAVPLALVATAVSNEPAAFLSFFLEGGVIGKMLRVGVWMNPLVRDFSFCACVFSVCGVAFLRCASSLRRPYGRSLQCSSKVYKRRFSRAGRPL